LTKLSSHNGSAFFETQCIFRIIDVRECDGRPHSADPSSRVAAATADRDHRHAVRGCYVLTLWSVIASANSRLSDQIERYTAVNRCLFQSLFINSIRRYSPLSR